MQKPPTSLQPPFPIRRLVQDAADRDGVVFDAVEDAVRAARQRSGARVEVAIGPAALGIVPQLAESLVDAVEVILRSILAEVLDPELDDPCDVGLRTATQPKPHLCGPHSP